MPLIDLPLDELRVFRPDVSEPADFDAFWDTTISETRSQDLSPVFTPAETPVRFGTVLDVSFGGWAGDRIAAWLILPPGDDPVGCVVRYIGYGGGRGRPQHHLAFPAAGWATLVMDSRGQGSQSTTMSGVTGDPHGTDNPAVPGVMTRGITDPATYYYRRLFADAYRAVDVALRHPRVDDQRIVVAGNSQAGALAQAMGALHPYVAAALIDVPFLSHIRRGAEIAQAGPYLEIGAYLASHRLEEERTFDTLSYFDGVNFARRGAVPALYSVGLMDRVVPPSTVFAAYNRWVGEKRIEVWPWNGHEGGETTQWETQCAFLSDLLGRP